MAKSATEAVVKQVVAAVPALRPIFDEHVAFNDGLLPHVFFGDVARFVTRAFEQGSGSPRVGAEKILQILEEAAASGDPRVVELISVSFLENLDFGAPTYRDIRSAMGSTLRRELARYEER